MTDEEYGKRYTELVRFYRLNPSAFSESDLDKIEVLGKSLGRKFNRDVEVSEKGLLGEVGDLVYQFGAGFGSGFTTIPMGEDPEDTSELIARSLGGVFGFLGIIPGAFASGGMNIAAIAGSRALIKTAGIAAKGYKAAAKGSKTASALKKTEAISRLGAQRASKLTTRRYGIVANVPSAPMFVGNQVLKYAKKFGVSEGASKFAGRYIKSQRAINNSVDALEAAIHLGAASSISSWSAGVDEMIKGGLIGAVEGGVFRGITNLSAMAKMFKEGGQARKNAQIALRSLSSGFLAGQLSSGRDEPYELQIYHYLLGTVFGYKDVPYAQRKAIEFVQQGVKKVRESDDYQPGDEMLSIEKLPEFDSLLPEVKDIVQDITLSEYGRRYDPIKLFSAALKDTGQLTKEDYNILRREYVQNIYNKNLKDLDGDIEAAKKLTGEQVIGKKLTDLLTVEEVQKYLVKETVQSFAQTYSPHYAFKLRLQASLEDHQIPTTIIDPLTEWSDGIVKSLSKYKPAVKDDIKQTTKQEIIEEGISSLSLDVAKIIQRGAKKGRTFDQIQRSIDSKVQKYNLKFDDSYNKKESINLLKRAYFNISQEKPLQHSVLDLSQRDNKNKVLPIIKKSTGVLSDGKRISETGSESFIEKIFSGKIFRVKYTDDGKTSRDVYRYFISRDGKTINKKRLLEYVLNAGRSNTPVLFGKKDSGTIIHSDGWAFDTTNNNWAIELRNKLVGISQINKNFNSQLKQILDNVLSFKETDAATNDLKGLGLTQKEIDSFNSTLSDDAVINNIIKFSKDGLESDATIRYKYMLNNIKIIERLNNKDIVDILRENQKVEDYNAKNPNKKKAIPFITTPEQINKRAQPLSDNAASLPESLGNLKAIIVNGTSAKSYLKELNIAETGSDGVFLLHPDYFNKIMEITGFDTKNGFAKATINSEMNDGRGLFIGKLGIHKASGRSLKMMDKYGINSIFYDTAVKQTGLRKVSELNFLKTTTKTDADIFEISPKDIRFNTGVYEKMPTKARVVKQLVSSFFTKESSQRYVEEHVIPSLEGNKEISEKALNGKLTPKEIRNLNVEDLSVSAITKIIFQPEKYRMHATDLYKKVVSDILSLKIRDEIIDPAEAKGLNSNTLRQEEIFNIEDFNSATDRILKIAAKIGEISPAIVQNNRVSPYFETILKEYIINRAIAPVVENSGSTFMYSNELFFQHDIPTPLRYGTYMFGKGMKDFYIKWIDGAQIKMGDAWELYQKELAKDKAEYQEVTAFHGYILGPKPAVSKEFTTFDINKAKFYKTAKNRPFKAVWFTDTSERALSFSESKMLTYELTSPEYTPKLKETKLYFENPLIIDAKGKMIDDLPLIKPSKNNDGVIIKNVRDSGFEDKRGYHTQYAVLKESVFKQKKSVVKDKPDPRLINEMQNAFEFIFVRTPQDSPSGARVLKFLGFSDRDGYGIHLHDKDMQYLGGADNDGDKVHFYQSLDGTKEGTPIKDHLKKYKDQFTVEDKVTDPKEIPLKTNTTEEIRIKQEAQKEQTVVDFLMPGAALETHISSTQGNSNVGIVANQMPITTGFASLFKGDKRARTIYLRDKDIVNIPGKTPEENVSINRIVINKIDETLDSYFKMSRFALNTAVDATGDVNLNFSNIYKMLSESVIQDVTYLDTNNNPVSKKRLSQNQLDFLESKTNYQGTVTAQKLRQINEAINGSRYENGYRKKIPFSQFISELRGFNYKYKDKFIGNAYYEAIKLLSGALKNSYSPAVTPRFEGPGTAPRKDASTMLRYAKPSSGMLINVMNRLLGRKSSFASQILKPSGIDQFTLIKEDAGNYLTVSESRQIEDAFQSIVAFDLAVNAEQAALKAGTSPRKISGIIHHINAIKYNYFKLTNKGFNDDATQKHILLYEDRYGLKINNIEDLISATKKYRAKLKTKEERDFYDIYGIGSLSEQKISIDDIAKYETIILLNSSNKKSPIKTYAQAKQIAKQKRYDNYTYDYITSAEFAQKNPYVNINALTARINRVYENKNVYQLWNSMDHVSDANIAKYIVRLNEILQAKESDSASKIEGNEITSSAIAEEILLKSIVKEEQRRPIKEAIDDALMLNKQKNVEGERLISYDSMFDAYDTSKPPKNKEEALRSSVPDEPIRQRYTEKFLELVLSDNKNPELFDAKTEYGKENLALLESLKEQMLKYDSIHVQHFSSIYENVIRKEIDASNMEDLRAFLRVMDSIHKRTFLEKVVDADPTQKVSRIYDLMFPDTIARIKKRYDAQISDPIVATVLTNDGFKSKEVRDIMSSYDESRKIFTSAEESKSSVYTLILEKNSEEFSYLDSKDILPYREQLGKAASAIHEIPELIKLRFELNKELGKPEPNPETIISLEYSIRQYEKSLKSIHDSYESLKDKTFTIQNPRNKEKRIKVTGKELMGEYSPSSFTSGKRGMISESIERLNKFYYKVFINPESAQKFAVRREDGSLDYEATIPAILKFIKRGEFQKEKIPNIGHTLLVELLTERGYLHREVNYNDKSIRVKDIENPGDREAIISNIRLKDRGYYIGDGPMGREYEKNPNGTYRLKPLIGKMSFDSYLPHRNFKDSALTEYQQTFLNPDGIKEINGIAATNNLTKREIMTLERMFAQQKGEDLGMLRDYIERVFTNERDYAHSYERSSRETTTNKYGNLAGRTNRILGEWDLSLNSYTGYATALNSGYHKGIGVLLGDYINTKFRESNVMGDMTESWAKFHDLYIQDFAGRPSSFSEEYYADPGLNLKRRPYYYLSDDAAQKGWNKIKRLVGGKQYEMGEGIKAQLDTIEFQAKLRSLSRLEAKAQLMSLLGNTTPMMNNYTGGTAMNVISSGFRPWKQANWKWINKNLNPNVKSREDLQKIAISYGATESMLKGEMSAADQLTTRGGEFIREMSILINNSEGLSPSQYSKRAVEIAKRNGFTDIMASPAAWMMSKVETTLRTRAWWSHLIQARETMMADGVSYKWDDPYLIQQALKGVWASQFLYNTPNRPAIARTNLGRIFTRFQLWSWNSVRFRRDVFNLAKESGFVEGSKEYERMKRMMQADLFVFSLASLMPISLFGNINPAPWSYLRDFSSFFFGDEEERDKAFFGQIPYPFSPIQMVLPPSSRYITNTIEGVDSIIAYLLDKEVSDSLDYKIMSMIPYGLLGRNIVRSIQNPIMADQFLTGIPMVKIGRIVKNIGQDELLRYNNVKLTTTNYADKEIKEMLEYLQSK